jgi:hypothetical protein
VCELQGSSETGAAGADNQAIKASFRNVHG